MTTHGKGRRLDGKGRRLDGKGRRLDGEGATTRREGATTRREGGATTRRKRDDDSTGRGDDSTGRMTTRREGMTTRREGTTTRRGRDDDSTGRDDERKIEASWLVGDGAVGAAGGVVLDDVVFVGAVAVVAGLADGLGYAGEFVGGVNVLVIDGDLGAAGDGEGVSGLLAVERAWGSRLRGLRGGRAGPGIAAEDGEGAGEAARRVAGVVVAFGACRWCGWSGPRRSRWPSFDLEHLGDGEGHEDEHDGHDDEELDEGEAGFQVRVSKFEVSRRILRGGAGDGVHASQRIPLSC